MILVDTNVWSELCRRQPHPSVLTWEMRVASQLWLSVIVLAEMRAGVALLPQGRNRVALSAMIEALVDRYQQRIVTFDERCSLFYGQVLADARAAGRPILTADAMIAATAHANGMRIATRDVHDFAGAGVEIVNPWES
ncbi:MAG: type II toxin-antitoxin system VapC family toxin [Sandaracinobacter sp.]